MRSACIIALLFLLSCFCSADNIVFFTEQDPPLNYQDDTGKITGVSVEIVTLLKNRLDRDAPIYIVPWARAYKFATSPNHKNTAIFSVAFNQQRQPLFKWVGPIGESSWAFYGRADTELNVKGLDDARLVRAIAVYRGDIGESLLKKELFRNLVPTLDSNQGLNQLMKGRVQLWLAHKAIAAELLKSAKLEEKVKLLYTVKTLQTFIAFNQQTDSNEVAVWQNMFERLYFNGELDPIWRKWGQSIPVL